MDEQPTLEQLVSERVTAAVVGYVAPKTRLLLSKWTTERGNDGLVRYFAAKRRDCIVAARLAYDGDETGMMAARLSIYSSDLRASPSVRVYSFTEHRSELCERVDTFLCWLGFGLEEEAPARCETLACLYAANVAKTQAEWEHLAQSI